jgi:hypothetical protein
VESALERYFPTTLLRFRFGQGWLGLDIVVKLLVEHAEEAVVVIAH